MHGTSCSDEHVTPWHPRCCLEDEKLDLEGLVKAVHKDATFLVFGEDLGTQD
jgi:hypothetical protein